MKLNFTPRPYQKEIAEKIKTAIDDGHKKILLQLGGGAGKTKTIQFLFSLLKGKRIFTTPRINLALQTYKESPDFFGLLQGKNRKNLDRDIVVANIHSLLNHPMLCDVVVHDEIHMLTSMNNRFNGATVEIGISATPYTAKAEPLRGWEDAYMIEHCYNENWLTENKFLTPMKYYNFTSIDTSKMKKNKSGEFTQGELDKLVKAHKFGDIIGSLKEKLGDRLGKESMLITASSIAHAIQLTEEFKNARFDARSITSKNPKALKVLEQFENKKFPIAVTVDMVSTGTDIPHLRHVVLARVYGSHTSYRQTTLRGTRLDRDTSKDFFYVWDFGGNWERLGNPLEHPVVEQQDTKTFKKKVITCSKCQEEGTILEKSIRFDIENSSKLVTLECSKCKNISTKVSKIKTIACEKCECRHIVEDIVRKDDKYIIECKECKHNTVIETIDIRPFVAVLGVSRKVAFETILKVSPKYYDYILAFVALVESSKLAFALDILTSDFYNIETKKKVFIKVLEYGKKKNLSHLNYALLHLIENSYRIGNRYIDLLELFMNEDLLKKFFNSFSDWISKKNLEKFIIDNR